MKIVMSWWTRPIKRVTPEMLERWALSCTLARKHYDRVELITDSLGKEWLIRRLGLPFTSVSTAFDDLSSGASPRVWALGKLIAYASQTEPFLHIDDDVFLFKPLPEEFLKADVCVQSVEYAEIYRRSLARLTQDEMHRVLPMSRFRSYNMGVFGGNKVEWIQGYAKRALEWAYKVATSEDPERVACIVLEQATLARQLFESTSVKVRTLFDDLSIGTVRTSGYSHICADKGDLKTVREVHSYLKLENPKAAERVAEWTAPIPPRVRRDGETVFHHYGDAGDIIYSLPTVKALGGGHLVLSPEIRLSGAVDPAREQMTRRKVDFLVPLLNLQPYIRSVNYAPWMPEDVDVDLSQYRRFWQSCNWDPRVNLVDIHARAFKVKVASHRYPWLDVKPSYPGPFEDYSIVVSRSARYHNDRFPWKLLVECFGSRMMFVGLREEHEVFCREFGEIVRYGEFCSALELACVIKSAKLFIGNQSLPYAIAEGLKVPTIQESWPAGPNCMFHRRHAQFVLDGTVDFKRIARILSK